MTPTSKTTILTLKLNTYVNISKTSSYLLTYYVYKFKIGSKMFPNVPVLCLVSRDTSPLRRTLRDWTGQ